MFPPSKPTSSFPYQVERQVGIGSMGVVYRANEVDLDRAVAIKTLRQSLLEEETDTARDEIRRRFLQEAQAAGRLSHPGVTTVYRVGSEGDMPYIVMEWLEGQTLEDVMKQRGPLQPVEAAQLAVALLETLDAAHRAGIVHRDVKPSNLVVLDDGRLKVTDFGIALVKGQDLVRTQAGVVLATPKFAAPEQLRGVEADGRTDLFATGVLLYHLVTNAFPFSGATFMELANAVLQLEPKPVREHNRAVPAALEAVILRALRKERKDRFADAGTMADALRAFTIDPSGSSTMISTVETADDHIGSSAPVVRDLPRDPARALVALASSWPARNLEKQSTAALVDRVLERPLHAAPFAGALFLGPACLFAADGVLLGAVDMDSGEVGDVVVESLPEKASARLHPVPESFPTGLVPTLTSVLAPPRVIHGDLDSSFINLPALARKLRDDGFDGVFRLRRGDDFGLVFFVQGEAAVSLYSKGWDGIDVEASWSQWLSQVPVMAQVERRSNQPPHRWYRRAFRDAELAVDRVEPTADGTGDTMGTTSYRLKQLFQSTSARTMAPGEMVVRRNEDDTRVGGYIHAALEEAPAYRLLEWALGPLLRHLAERNRLDGWRYLAHWLLDVRRVVLHHDLPRPDSAEADAFDLVTFGGEADSNKVLHLGHRLARPTVEDFQGFVDRVIAAKQARTKTGDVGGVLLVARHLSDDVVHAYRELVTGAGRTVGSWLTMEESFTGYEGFVRVGPRRGFHLMLVEEDEDGSFRPVPVE